MDANKYRRQKLRSLSYSDMKRFSECPKQFWLRYNRVGEDTVRVETREATIGDIVHRVLSGQDHPKRVKKLLEKQVKEGALVTDNLVEMEKECHARIKAARNLKKSDVSENSKTEKKFYYTDNFKNRITGEKDQCTLVSKPDRIGEYVENFKVFPEIVEIKNGKPRRSHVEQLLFAALVYSRHNQREKWHTRAIRLVINYVSLLQESSTVTFATQHRLEEFFNTRVSPVIEEINNRIPAGDFPAQVEGWKCNGCPFAAECEEFQSSLNQNQGGHS